MSIKRKFLLLLVSLFVLCSLAFVGTATIGNANADSSFKVIDGAAIRLESNEDGAYGIRFTATVGTKVDGATYKMAIVPKQLVDLYDTAKATADAKSESIDDIITWLNDFAESKGGSIAIGECEVSGSGEISCALTDIYKVNFDRQFMAIAFYEKGGEIVIAERADDGVRSYGDVAQNAKDSGDYDKDTEILAILDKVLDSCSKKSEGILIDSEELVDLFSVNSEKGTGTITADEVNETQVWSINLTEKKSYDHMELKIDNAKLQNAIQGFTMVEFSVYNAGDENGSLYLSKGEGMVNNTTYPLPRQSWSKVCISVEDLATKNYMTFPYAKLNAPYYITEFKGYTANEIVDIIESQIGELPEKENINGLYLPIIEKIDSELQMLSSAKKESITNLTKYNEIKEFTDNSFVAINNYIAIKKFVYDNGYQFSDYANENEVTTAIGYDDVYGDYLSATFLDASHKTGHFNYTYVDTSLETKLAGCEKVYFGVYNGGANNRSLFTNIGGFNADYATLVAGQWTLVSFNASDFISGKYFGVIEAQKNTEYKFSRIYATTSEYVAKPVIDLIDSLPQTPTLSSDTEIQAINTAYNALSETAKAKVTNYATFTTFVDNYNILLAQDVVTLIDNLPEVENLSALDYSKINEIKTAYNSLPTPAQAKVTNYATFTAFESAYSAKYTVFDWTGASPASMTANYSTGVDNEYGYYHKVSDITAYTYSAHIAINGYQNNVGDIFDGCDAPYFYAYIEGNENLTNREFLTNSNALLSKLEPGKWVKITITDISLYTDATYLYIYGATNVTEFRFTPIFAESLVEKVIGLINDLPEIDNMTAFDYSKINEIKTIYNALSTTAQAKVTNYATFTAFESAYNTKYTVFDWTELKSGGDMQATFSTGNDGVYGYYHKVSDITAYMYGSHIGISGYQNNVGDIFDGCDAPYFYAYIDGDNLTKKFETGGVSGNMKSGEWVKITITDISKFKTDSYMYIFDVKNKITELRLTPVFAENLVEKVIGLINDLPEISDMTALDYSKINEIKTAYNALPATVQAKVTNYATFTAFESAYSAKYTVFDWTGLKSGGDMQATFSTGNDNEYGYYHKISDITAYMYGSHIGISGYKDNVGDIFDGCDAPYFYAYIDGDNLTKKFETGGVSGNMKSGEWVKITITDISKFKTDSYMYIHGATNVTELRFTPIFAENLSE